MQFNSGVYLHLKTTKNNSTDQLIGVNFTFIVKPFFILAHIIIYPGCLACFIYSTAKVFVVEIDLEHAVTGRPFHHALVCLHSLDLSVVRRAHGLRSSSFFFDVTYAPLADTS